MMQVKGKAMISLPLFIIKKFGKDGYSKWLKSLSPEAKKVYSVPISENEWYSLNTMLAEPTKAMCDLFYNKGMKGASECGRFSAEYGLKGIFKMLIKLSTPLIIIKKASSIMQSYYDPSELKVIDYSEGNCVVNITKFPDPDSYIEYRIAGWMQRAVEICGARNVSVQITKTLTKDDPITEYQLKWKK